MTEPVKNCSADIVDRLREKRGVLDNRWPGPTALEIEAANEIEHLRLEHAHACQEIGVAIAERDQLRDAAQAEQERIAELQYEAGMYRSLYETAIARCARVADEMREKHGKVTGSDYECGVWDQGVRIAGKLRDLIVQPPAATVEIHGDGYCGCTERCRDRDNCKYDVKPVLRLSAGNADKAREIVTDWLSMFDPPPQIDFQQSELLQGAIAAALGSVDIDALTGTADDQVGFGILDEPQTSLESLLREYARDLRRNSSGGDDYDYERGAAEADYLETLIARSKSSSQVTRPQLGSAE